MGRSLINLMKKLSVKFVLTTDIGHMPPGSSYPNNTWILLKY